MEALTLIIAVGGTALIFALPPVQGLVVFFAALIWYPSTLTVQLGTSDFSVCRILVLALLLQVAMNYSDWLGRFWPAATKQEPFYLVDGKKIDVPMMHRSDEYRFVKTDRIQAVELPYEGERFALVVI